MSVKVKTPYTRNFRIPHSCVACSGTPGTGTTWKVSGAKSNWSGKRTTTLSLELPLCQECYTVSRDKKLAKFITAMGILLPTIICLTAPWVVADKYMGVGILVGLGLIIVVIVLVIWLTNRINQKDFTDEQREQRKKVKKCAKISSFKAPGLFDKTGSIIFEFENPTYAQEFASMNVGKVI
jgi:hypothetical protein